MTISQDLKKVADAVRIEEADFFRIEGEGCTLPSLSELRQDGWIETGIDTGIDTDSDDLFLQSLAREIYRRLYVRTDIDTRSLDPMARRAHIARLSAANSGRGIKEFRGLQTGFYFAIGDGTGAEPPDAGLPLRFYWHLTEQAAIPFIRRLTARFNAAGVAFRAKVLSDPQAYDRGDAGVLYISRADALRMRSDIAAIRNEIHDGLRPSVPLWTHRLAPGLAVAEDLKDGSSFGRHRSRLMARGLLRAFEHGRAERPLDDLVETLREAGLDPARPHLGPGSEEIPLVVDPVFDPVLHVAVARPEPPAQADDETFYLDAARRLGDALVEQAWWHEGHCNWLGRDAQEVSSWNESIVPTLAALGADLYGGTAGIAFFLAELHAHTGEQSYRATALGAVRQSLRRLREEPEHLDFHGLYCGRLGAVWANLRSARLCADAELEALQGLQPWLIDPALSAPKADLLASHAGTILVLLNLFRTMHDDSLLATAVRLGEDLRRRAVRSGEAWSWPFTSDDEHLTGLSHGAAGIGLALLELSAATGRETFRDAARRAFAFEEELFDARHGNWPDLRLRGDDPKRRFMNAWCHGAPGIVLSRLRALQLDPERADVYRREIDAGLATVRIGLERRSASPKSDTGLCHGVAGLGEVLLLSAQILGQDEDLARSRRAARALVAHHGASGDWPSGAPSRGPNPSLMLGLAGVGLWMLRLHPGATAPSILLPGSIV